MADLDRLLQDVAAAIDVRDLDGFTDDTMAAIEAARRRRGFRLITGGRATLLVAAAAVVLALLGAVLVVPSSRDAVADLFRVGGVRIETGAASPSSAPPASAVALSSTTAPPGPLATFGRPADVDEARALRADLRTLPGLGPPVAVYLGDRSSRMVTFAWGATNERPPIRSHGDFGVVLQQFDSFEFALDKSIGSSNGVVSVRINGKAGYWIEGDHQIELIAKGASVRDSARWSSSVLILQDGAVTYRIESKLTLDVVKALAATLAPLL